MEDGQESSCSFSVRGIRNLPVSARFSLKMMDSRLNRFLAIINSNRLETHGIPSTLSLIKSKEILSIGISCYLPFFRDQFVELGAM